MRPSDDRRREDTAAWIARISAAVRRGEIDADELAEMTVYHESDGSRERAEVSLSVDGGQLPALPTPPGFIPVEERPPMPTMSNGPPQLSGTPVHMPDPDEDEDEDAEPEASIWQDAFTGIQESVNGMAMVGRGIWPLIIFGLGWPMTVGWWVKRDYAEYNSLEPDEEDYLMAMLFGGLVWFLMWLLIIIFVGAMLDASGIWEPPA